MADKCPRCNKKAYVPFYEKDSEGKTRQRFKCLSCGYFSIPEGIFDRKK